MRFVSSLVLFILFAMIAEDATAAHATSQVNSEKIISALIDSQHEHTPFQNCNTTTQRDTSHFGHCSFLLVGPLRDFQVGQRPSDHFSIYFFSLKINNISSLLRPPILA